MNIKTKAVELRTSKHTTDTGALQKGADFVQAFCLGFDVEDSIALLRLDDLYIETFESKNLPFVRVDWPCGQHSFQREYLETIGRENRY